MYLTVLPHSTSVGNLNFKNFFTIVCGKCHAETENVAMQI
jgi:hypothetical protein